MRKFLTILMMAFMLVSCSSVKETACETPKKRWFEKDPRIEVVNETTVIFKNVVKIEIRSCSRCKDQVTYIYDLKHGKLVKAARGSFEVELAYGHYLVQSNKKITRLDYEVLIE